MRVPAAVMALVVAASATIGAQYGHPLKGSWSGDWGRDAASRTRVLIEMDWNGTAVTGRLSPGPNAVELTRVELNFEDWTVHLEATGKDASGRQVPVRIDGKLENLGSYNRTISGTWIQGTDKGTFKITRN